MFQRKLIYEYNSKKILYQIPHKNSKVNKLFFFWCVELFSYNNHFSYYKNRDKQKKNCNKYWNKFMAIYQLYQFVRGGLMGLLVDDGAMTKIFLFAKCNSRYKKIKHEYYNSTTVARICSNCYRLCEWLFLCTCNGTTIAQQIVLYIFYKLRYG